MNEIIEKLISVPAPPAPDYRQRSCWAALPKSIDKAVDTVFFLATAVLKPLDTAFASIDDLAEMSAPSLKGQASVFMECTNVFVPLYRQATFESGRACLLDYQTYLDLLHYGVSYTDLSAALDYYFEHYNQGRPFIFAGHSQGSALIINLLGDYMALHPQYLDRMVAAYCPGYVPDSDFIAAHPYLKAAQRADDTGVTVAWNTEGPGAVGVSVVMPKHATTINPLNWRTDDVYASAAENLGSLVHGEILMNYADAQIDIARGTVISHAPGRYVVDPLGFATQSLHLQDYGLFYNNIKENVALRVQRFLTQKGSRPSDGSLFKV